MHPHPPWTCCVMPHALQKNCDTFQEFVAHYKNLVPVTHKLVPKTRNKNNWFPQSSIWVCPYGYGKRWYTGMLQRQSHTDNERLLKRLQWMSMETPRFSHFKWTTKNIKCMNFQIVSSEIRMSKKKENLTFFSGGFRISQGAPTYYWTNFSRKLHENEEFLNPGTPLRSTTFFSWYNHFLLSQ